MKRVSVSFDRSHVVVDDDHKAKVKYQSLLKEYLELQKVFVSKKRKLQAAKQKSDTILAEVRFLRRRHKYLSKIKNQRTPMTPAENSKPIPESHLEDEDGEGEEEQVLEEEVGVSEEPNKYLIHDKRISKRDMFLASEVNLKV